MHIYSYVSIRRVYIYILYYIYYTILYYIIYIYIRMYVGHPSRNGNPSSEYIEYLTPFTIFKSISMDQWPVAQIALHSLAEKRAPHPSLQPSLQPLESTRLRQAYPNVCTLRTLLDVGLGNLCVWKTSPSAPSRHVKTNSCKARDGKTWQSCQSSSLKRTASCQARQLKQLTGHLLVGAPVGELKVSGSSTGCAKFWRFQWQRAETLSAESDPICIPKKTNGLETSSQICALQHKCQLVSTNKLIDANSI